MNIIYDPSTSFKTFNTFKKLAKFSAYDFETWKYNGIIKYQIGLMQKLYAKYGLTITMTCNAMPEQYEVKTADNKSVGYLRYRHGTFRVDYPDCGDETILSEDPPSCSGEFNQDERLVYLTKALRAILKEINRENQS